MSAKPASQPSLAELTGRMMTRRTADAVFAGPEVEPHEVMTGFRTDPRTAYADATAALRLLGVTGMPTSLPPEWASFVAVPVESPAIPMAAGEFPQRVRDLATLAAADDLTELQPQACDPAQGFTSLRKWAAKNAATDGVKWLAAGVSRGLGGAEAIEGTDAVAVNEAAAMLWKTGRCAEAVNMWFSMPYSPVAAFNLGMGLLFTDHIADAVPHLKAAAAGLPEASGWSHLAQLYLAVALSR